MKVCFYNYVFDRDPELIEDFEPVVEKLRGALATIGADLDHKPLSTIEETVHKYDGIVVHTKGLDYTFYHEHPIPTVLVSGCKEQTYCWERRFETMPPNHVPPHVSFAGILDAEDITRILTPEQEKPESRKRFKWF